MGHGMVGQRPSTSASDTAIDTCAISERRGGGQEEEQTTSVLPCAIIGVAILFDASSTCSCAGVKSGRGLGKTA